VKLFVKENPRLTLSIVGLLSVLVISISFSVTLSPAVKAQSQDQTAEEVQQKLNELSQKFREIVTNAGINLTLPQGGNLTDNLQALIESGSFGNLSEQLSQLSQVGINTTNIENLQEQAGSDLAGLVQKLQNLTSSR
jgi:hypothetical protein